MANVTTGDPFIIDTATATAIMTNIFDLYAIAWTSGSTADGISIQDENGVVIYASVGNGANYSERFPFPSNHPIFMNGLKVPTLDSGKVYLYVKVRG